MSRYIDADALLEILPSIEDEYKFCRKIISEQPTADVVEVVHGKWIKMDKRGNNVRCSKCGNTLDLRGVNAGRGDANYCPNCGAKMERREDGKMNNLVKRTERGWAGHYICADRCKFRRNTLLEYKDRKWIVSTVGSFCNPRIDMIGADRWYETMVFEAELQKGYWDADVSRPIYPEQDCGIYGNSWEQVLAEHPCPDNDANDMHERIVEEMIERIVMDNGEEEDDERE